MAWGFTVPVRKDGAPNPGDASASSGSGSAPPLPNFTPRLQETEGEEEDGGADSDEEYGIQQRQRSQVPASSGMASPSSASAPLGYTIDLDREFGGDTRALWGFRTLNHVQSACFPLCFNTDHNVVIAGALDRMQLQGCSCPSSSAAASSSSSSPSSSSSS